MRFSIPVGVVIHKGSTTVTSCSAQYLCIFGWRLQNTFSELKWPDWELVTWGTDKQWQARGMERTPTQGTMLWHRGAGRSLKRSLGTTGAITECLQQWWQTAGLKDGAYVLFLSLLLCDFKHWHKDELPGHPLCISPAVAAYHWLKITLAFRIWGSSWDLVS